MPFPGLTTFPSTALFPGLDSAGGGPLTVVLGDRFEEAIRAGGTQWAEVDALRNGVVVRDSLPIVGGSVTDDSSPGVRRMLELALAPEPGLFDLLAPTGTQLAARSVVRYPDGSTESVPLGVFDVDVEKIGYAPSADLQLTAPDKWVKVQRARFLVPQASAKGIPITEQITRLIRGALGPSEPVINNATSTDLVGALVWEEDRAQAIIDLADSIGAYVSFNRDGVATIDELPTLGAAASWLVDARPKGVLLSADRSRNRQKTYNVVVARSEKADGTVPFQPVRVGDTDPTSPTYAGQWPFTDASLAGAFGIVPYKFASPLLNNQTQAYKAARTILARVTGLASQLSLTAVRNPKLDALDVIDVLLPAEAGVPRAMERHIVDRVTHPLTVDGAQEIAGRSTRTDEYS